MDEDFLLLHRMKQGDEDAIEEFVRKYYPMILRYCHLHTGGSSYAEDLTQETFARFFRTFSQYQHYGKAANYLYVIAGNCCKDHFKKQPELSLEDVAEPCTEGLEPTEQQMDIHMALKKLPKELRDVTILYFFQDITQKQIAKVLGIGLPLVKYRLKRAKEILSKYLREEELS